MRQPRPDYDPGFRVKVRKPFQVSPPRSAAEELVTKQVVSRKPPVEAVSIAYEQADKGVIRE